jgi:uncharacterized membrane protein
MEARYAITVNASEDTVRRMWDDVDLDGSPLQKSGRVRFARAPGGRGTEVHAEADYTMPGGTMGSAVAKVFREEPAQRISDGLRMFKQVVETGELARSQRR